MQLEAGGFRRAIASPMAAAEPLGKSDRPGPAGRTIASRGKECAEVAAHGRSGAIAFEAAPRLSM
jgi:hypothetical protein